VCVHASSFSGPAEDSAGHCEFDCSFRAHARDLTGEAFAWRAPRVIVAFAVIQQDGRANHRRHLNVESELKLESHFLLRACRLVQKKGTQLRSIAALLIRARSSR